MTRCTTASGATSLNRVLNTCRRVYSGNFGTSALLKVACQVAFTVEIDRPGKIGLGKTYLLPKPCCPFHTLTQDGKVGLRSFAYPVDKTVEKIRAMPIPAAIQGDLITVLRTGADPEVRKQRRICRKSRRLTLASAIRQAGYEPDEGIALFVRWQTMLKNKLPGMLPPKLKTLSHPIQGLSRTSVCHIYALWLRRAMSDLLIHEAKVLDQLAESMQRFALKHEGLSIHLVKKEERKAPRQALMLLIGHPNSRIEVP